MVIDKTMITESLYQYNQKTVNTALIVLLCSLFMLSPLSISISTRRWINKYSMLATIVLISSVIWMRYNNNAYSCHHDASKQDSRSNANGQPIASSSRMPSPSSSLLYELLLRYLSPATHVVLSDVLFIYMSLCILLWMWNTWRALTLANNIKVALMNWAFSLVRDIPLVKAELKKEADKMERSLEEALKGGHKTLKEDGVVTTNGNVNGSTSCPNERLPKKGVEHEKLIALMKAGAGQHDHKWESGKASGAVYHGGREHVELMVAAYGTFSNSNPLHPDLFPMLMKFESEVISMTARLLDGNDSGIVGCLTSGGTESIILAVKAHREYFKDKGGIIHPEIVACVTAHAGLDKACEMLGITLRKVPMDLMTCEADVAAVQRAISVNTIMIYASAPQFPHGIIDPVSELSAIALQHGCGLHVDGCLGGFVLPFARKLGAIIPPFDFSLPGVTSMSVDTHKYGYASKGTSVVLYRNKELRAYQYFCYPDWTGGLYVTPTLAGSRPGGLIAAAWAAMMAMGEEGYLKATQKILDTLGQIVQGVSEIPELRVLGTPKAMIVCIGSSSGSGSYRKGASNAGAGVVNIYRMSDGMSKRGWSLNALQHPACVHLCVTLQTVGHETEFLSDLRAAVKDAKQFSGKDKEDSNAHIYGMADGMPAGPVNVLLQTYTDVILKVEKA